MQTKIMSPVFTLQIYKDWEFKPYNGGTFFIVHDTLGMLSIMERNDATLVHIVNYNGTQEQKEQSLKDIISTYGNRDDVAIITEAYISTVEFPESEYYDPRTSVGNLIKDETKKPLPYEEVIKRDSDLLESLGFININDYVQYEYSVAYVYGNKLGNEIRDAITKIKQNKEFMIN